MSSSRSTLLVAVVSCAATLVFVSTANVSCGTVQPPTACAADCPDVPDLGPLTDRIAALEAGVANVRASLAPVAFVGFLGAPQAIATAVDTQVVVDSVLLDTNNAFDMVTHEYVAPVAGQYVIVATVAYAGMDGARANNQIRIVRKSNQEVIDQLVATVPGNSSGVGSLILRVNSATAIHLEIGDRVSLRTFQDSGAPKNLIMGSRESSLEIARIPSVS